jgi:hypothetical protein
MKFFYNVIIPQKRLNNDIVKLLEMYFEFFFILFRGYIVLIYGSDLTTPPFLSKNVIEPRPVFVS